MSLLRTGGTLNIIRNLWVSASPREKLEQALRVCFAEHVFHLVQITPVEVSRVTRDAVSPVMPT